MNTTYQIRYEAVSDAFREDADYLHYLRELSRLEMDLVAALRRSNYEDTQLEELIEAVDTRMDSIRSQYSNNNA